MNKVLLVILFLLCGIMNVAAKASATDPGLYSSEALAKKDYHNVHLHILTHVAPNIGEPIVIHAHEFEKLTGYPLIVNTSFNIRGEPIVCTPEDAYKCFMGTEIDVLVLDEFVLFKTEQPKINKESYKTNFELD